MAATIMSTFSTPLVEATPAGPGEDKGGEGKTGPDKPTQKMADFTETEAWQGRQSVFFEGEAQRPERR